MMKDSSHFNFDGNIESRDIFGDHADVIVCDGFTGNVVLKKLKHFIRLLKKERLKTNISIDLTTKIMVAHPSWD